MYSYSTLARTIRGMDVFEADADDPLELDGEVASFCLTTLSSFLALSTCLTRVLPQGVSPFVVLCAHYAVLHQISLHSCSLQIFLLRSSASYLSFKLLFLWTLFEAVQIAPLQASFSYRCLSSLSASYLSFKLLFLWSLSLKLFQLFPFKLFFLILLPFELLQRSLPFELF